MIDVGTKELEFFTNEAVEGESLAERLARASLQAEDALRYAIEIGTALERAHRQGVIHGQLSAHAILLTASGARIARPAAGNDPESVFYRSPEQVRGSRPDWRSDIFSYGALMFEMASGRRAFSGEGSALDQMILEQPPDSLMSKSPVYAAMEGVIAGCLEKDPARRRQRAQNAVTELKFAGRSLARIARLHEHLRSGEVVPAGVRVKARQVDATMQFPDEIRGVAYIRTSRRLSIALFAVLAVAITAALAWLAWQYFCAAPALLNFQMSPANAIYRTAVASRGGAAVGQRFPINPPRECWRFAPHGGGRPDCETRAIADTAGAGPPRMGAGVDPQEMV